MVPHVLGVGYQMHLGGLGFLLFGAFIVKRQVVQYS